MECTAPLKNGVPAVMHVKGDFRLGYTFSTSRIEKCEYRSDAIEMIWGAFGLVVALGIKSKA